MRTRLLLSSVLLGVLGALTLPVTPADAAIGHNLVLTFGSFTKPTDVTVAQSSGNVYVTDSGANVIDVFGAEGGSPVGVLSPLTGSGAPKEFHFGGEPSQVAIDESSDLSHGDLYVSDAKNNVVDKFKPNGSGGYEYLCQFTGYGKGCVEKPTEEPTWSEPDGVAVDSQGNVYVASFGPGKGAVSEFNSEGQDERQLVGGDIGAGGGESGPVGVVADAAGDIYVNNYQHNVVEVDSGGHELFLDTNGSRGVAVDAHGNVFVDDSSYIAEYNQAGEEVDNFGEGIIGASEGVAVNDSTGNVYVSDRSNNDIEVFAQVVVPDAKTGGSSGVKGTTATVSGSVNPEGVEAHYFFEYGPCSENEPSECSVSPYSEKTPEEALEEPTGSKFEPAGTSLVGLAPETAYHYRLVGVNVHGERRGKEELLTTGPAVAGVSTTVATSLQPTSATLNGLLDPEGTPTHYFFEYVPEEKYNSGAPNPYSEGTSTEAEAGERDGGGQEAASLPIAGLEVGTTYHYRIVTFNEHGRTFGQDQTLTTPPALPAVDDHQLSFATGVSLHEATLYGTVNPGRGITTYHFVYGPTSAYGSSAAEAYTQLNYEDNSVEQVIAGLQQGVVYHYALVATNASGTTVGPEGEFTTLEANQPSTETGGPSGPSLEVTSTPGIVQPGTPTLLPTPVFPAITPLKTPPPVKCKKGFVKKGGKCVKKPHKKVKKRKK